MNPKEFYLSHKDNIKDHYTLHETIGEGALSRVRRGVHINSGITRAIKVVKKEDLEFGDRRKLLDEIELLKELDHINIGQVFEMYEDRKKLYFVNEMCQGGSLYDRVTQDRSLNEVKIANIMRQLFSATAYLHENNIVHGDLQPKNIHFVSPEKDIIKIIDFGTSRRVNEQHAMHGVFGTCYYLAPEVIEGEYSEKCDVWSLGVILYILLSGEPPFNADTDVEVVEKIKIGEYSLEGVIWNEISPQAKDLIQNLLVRQGDRLSARKALQHPWFKLCKEIEDQNPDAHRSDAIYRALANLSTFSSKNKVKQAALGFLIQHFLQMNEAVEL